MTAAEPRVGEGLVPFGQHLEYKLGRATSGRAIQCCHSNPLSPRHLQAGIDNVITPFARLERV
jgi:hypothetical protein